MMKLAAVLVVAACGRVGFHEPPADATPDAIDADNGPAPTHRYPLQDTYADDLGGPPLSPLGGAFDGGGYRFGVNQGLALANAMPIDVYTLDITVALDELTDWRKLVDYKALATDDGVYLENARLAFVEQAGMQVFVESPPSLVAGVPVEITITRDVTGTVIGYIDRMPQITTTDSLGAGTFTAQFAAANFAVDDHSTNQTEAGSGVIREIRIWNTALTAAEIAAL